MNYTLEDKIAFRKKDKQSLFQTFINCWGMIYEGTQREPDFNKIKLWVAEVEEEVLRQTLNEFKVEDKSLKEDTQELEKEFSQVSRFKKGIMDLASQNPKKKEELPFNPL